MPIYEYECSRCGHQTEVWQNFSDPPVTQCELCRGKMKRVISQSTFHLKGKGWYVTDYASKRGGSKPDKGGKESTDQPKKEASSTNDKKDKD